MPAVTAEPGHAYRLRNKPTGRHLTGAAFGASTCATVHPSVASGHGRPAQGIRFRADRYVLERTEGSTARERRTTTDRDTGDSVHPPATG
ncbi:MULTISPECIES: hypothetical protein [unclassified Streptomyces]|uniref:hypothetical protein n=1 Tax=unclassified Streptomyces TaxID=2593676 RepID=UPI00044B536F|nr:hypothetical protein [Streptomyces sp. PCS3-D2]WKV71846.1 hypothetical protein AW27_010130 [Streptomyces sp. PCS3-D2]